MPTLRDGSIRHLEAQKPQPPLLTIHDSHAKPAAREKLSQCMK